MRVSFPRFAASALALALSACTHVVQPPAPGKPPAPISEPRYEIVENRGADVVAHLRAAAPPAQPEVADGHNVDADDSLLGQQGLVKIGIGHFPARDIDKARDQALRQAHAVGADKMLVYPPSAAEAELVATYYVHLRLPFGAIFRDLSADERQQLGGDGVLITAVIGGTPASAANLRGGDFVLKFDRVAVRDKNAFQGMLQDHQGKRVTLTIRRDGIVLDRLVRLGTLGSQDY